MPISFCRLLLFFALTLVLIAPFSSAASSPRASGDELSSTPPLKALFITGGVFHDYDKLAPYLTSQLSKLINIKFDVITNLNPLTSEHFADGCPGHKGHEDLTSSPPSSGLTPAVSLESPA